MNSVHCDRGDQILHIISHTQLFGGMRGVLLILVRHNATTLLCETIEKGDYSIFLDDLNKIAEKGGLWSLFPAEETFSLDMSASSTSSYEYIEEANGALPQDEVDFETCSALGVAGYDRE